MASSPHELLALSYFRYLEQRQFISRDKNYFYLDLLKKASKQLMDSQENMRDKNIGALEESVVLYFELLRAAFPLGAELDYGETHKPFADHFSLAKEPLSEDKANSIRLISRVFSLINMPPPKKWSNKKNRLRVKQNAAVDYDVAAFNTYLNQVRTSLQNFVRSVAYDQYQKIQRDQSTERDVKHFLTFDKHLPFSKFSGAFMGALVKDFLVHGKVNQGVNFHLSRGEVMEHLEKGLIFWAIVLTVNKAIAEKDPTATEPFA